MQSYQTMETPLGTLFLAAEDGFLTHLTANPLNLPAQIKQEETPFLKEAIAQLEEYFAKKRTNFSLPLAPKGTAFQQRVWASLEKIPFGETTTYGEIAKALEKPTACRAVGGAIGKNPLLILVPCHRVIGKNGSLTGFSAGMERKKYLLTLEEIDY